MGSVVVTMLLLVASDTSDLFFPLYGIRRSVLMIRDEIFETICRPNGHETVGF
jgi:hypothetical protein